MISHWLNTFKSSIGVIGLFKVEVFDFFPEFSIAFFIAKNWDIAKSKGGSPTAFDLNIVFSSFGLFLRSLTLNSCGISLLPGILYVEGPIVRFFPSSFEYNSSQVSHPSPCINPPSIWPISIDWLRDSPQSSIMWAFKTVSYTHLTLPTKNEV